METKNFFKDVYDDFFGIEKIKRENEKIREELNITQDYPTIEVKKIEKNESKEEYSITKEDKDSKMVELFEKIENLYIKEDSKETLKKVIEYQRKYEEGLEKEYIPFNLCIYSDNKELQKELINIIYESVRFFNYLNKQKTEELSFYSIEKPEDIEKYYNNENGIIVLKDFEGFLSQEQIFKDKFIHRLEEKHQENGKYLTVTITKNKEIVSQAFEKNEGIKENLFQFEIIGTKPDVQDVYQEVLNKLKENYKITEDFELALLDYVSATYPKTFISFPEYRDTLCKKILFNKKEVITKEDIPTYEKEKTTEEIFEELNSLVGLTKVKQVFKDLVSLIELKNKTKDDLKIKNTNLHMIFLGNPGTGKTTVARIIAEMLYNLKYVKQNKLIEVSSKDLVAEYVGQTAPKTMAVIEKAMGGVLFIDEAYSLASGKNQGNSYNEEAIATLIQAMENYRDEFVVIFAGYTKEMQDFLNSNSGIVSRIGYTLEFDDYTEDELIEIFKQMVTKAGFILSDDAIERAREIIREYKTSENFGNARFVRNLYEKSVIKHASNTEGKKQKKILKTITAKDINADNLLK